MASLEDTYERLNNFIIDENKKKNIIRWILSLIKANGLKKFINSLNINEQDKDGQTLLDYAVLRGNEKLVKVLLKNGANVKSYNDSMKQLINSIIAENSSMMKLLLKNGANINASDVDGKTPLMFAVSNEKVEMINEIIKIDKHINAVDANNETALMYAVRSGNIKIVETLLNNKANLYIENIKGETALMIAAYKKDHDMINFLVSRGADLNEENRYGKSAKMILKENSNDTLYENGYEESIEIIPKEKESWGSILIDLKGRENSFNSIKGTLKNNTIEEKTKIVNNIPNKQNRAFNKQIRREQNIREK